MICTLSKWFISNSIDTNKEIPGLIKNHVKRCDSCQEYQIFSRKMAEKALQDAVEIMMDTPDLFLKKIRARAYQPVKTEEKTKSKLRLVPIVSTAAALIFILIFIFFNPFYSSKYTPSSTQFEFFSSINLSGASFQSLTAQLDSPYSKEWQSLGNAVQSAADKLLVNFEIMIDQPED